MSVSNGPGCRGLVLLGASPGASFLSRPRILYILSFCLGSFVPDSVAFYLLFLVSVAFVRVFWSPGMSLCGRYIASVAALSVFFIASLGAIVYLLRGPYPWRGLSASLCGEVRCGRVVGPPVYREPVS